MSDATDPSAAEAGVEHTASIPVMSEGHGFGTAPVFLAAISTILGAVMFLRFGYAVGHVGFTGAVAIILLGHLVTVPTALAISEIATNRRVEGGGEYFIVSRSFGPSIGGVIGVSLYFSQAISVAFYMIAFAEAFWPLAPWIEEWVGIVAPGQSFDPRWISLPGTVFLLILVVTRGAALGVKALWVVVSVLAVSLVLFFIGNPTAEKAAEIAGTVPMHEGTAVPDPFIIVFAIVFPAFTGMTAGVGLSGDLANPRRSIPLGTLSATVLGLIIYIAMAWKLDASATQQQLMEDQLVMSSIALWGPAIYLGLGCATLSSAIGSVLVAPRTLQALCSDEIAPWGSFNRVLSRGVGEAKDPRNATLFTGLLAIVFVSLGDVNFVARIISMFFMVTYGSLCAISFLEHFAARPSYRPSFRSKATLSAIGALMCVGLMFQMDPLYALLSMVVMTGLYFVVRSTRKGEVDDLAAIFQGAMTQATRWMQLTMQKRLGAGRQEDWRPSVLMVNARRENRSAPIELMTWICRRFGFGTYLQLINGSLEDKTYLESRRVLEKIIRTLETKHAAIFVDTIISPSAEAALEQCLQVPGVSGMENNTALFEFSRDDPREDVDAIVQGCHLAAANRMSSLVLRHGYNHFGNRENIDIWLTWNDYRNASLMILLAYIMVGHPEWRDAEIRIFAAFPTQQVEDEARTLKKMIAEGRIPISPKNIRIIPTTAGVDYERLVQFRSGGADLVIMGLTRDKMREHKADGFRRFPELTDVLWVMAEQSVAIE
ncbi:MAG: APC family permease [Planctomycetota bacterium]|jgi:amino acid transporter